jgi:transposase
MSAKERERMKVLARVKRKEMTLQEAAVMLGVSYRQVRRQNQRYLEEGDRGLVHKGRGKVGNRSLGAKLKEAVLDRYKSRYPDFGPTFAAEKLEEDGYQIKSETLRLWLLEAGLRKKGRKRKAHRSWRERKGHFGEMLQLDGSHHKWFEERAGKCCLMNLVDDATGRTHSIFAEEETTEAAMLLLWGWIRKYGIPVAIYADRKNVYLPDQKLAKSAREEGRELYTQFGRACASLGIRVIAAHSPQAKGRVERSHGVYQDRLVKELRLRDINDIRSANTLLRGGFIEGLNRKFAVEPREKTDLHRSPKGYDLPAIFCYEEKRSLTADWIVRFNNGFYQLAHQGQAPPAVSYALVRRYLNGSLHFSYRDQSIGYKKLIKRPGPVKKQAKRVGPAIPKPKTAREDHPWRKYPSCPVTKDRPRFEPRV